MPMVNFLEPPKSLKFQDLKDKVKKNLLICYQKRIQSSVRSTLDSIFLKDKTSSEAFDAPIYHWSLEPPKRNSLWKINMRLTKTYIASLTETKLQTANSSRESSIIDFCIIFCLEFDLNIFINEFIFKKKLNV